MNQTIPSHIMRNRTLRSPKRKKHIIVTRVMKKWISTNHRLKKIYFEIIYNTKPFVMKRYVLTKYILK